MSQTLTSQHIDEPRIAPTLPREGWGRLAMLLFLASDGVTFAGLLSGSLVLRGHNADWPHPADHLAFSLGAVMTALLLGSSVTMVRALAAAKRDARRQFSLFLSLTMLAGALFLALQAYEWSHLLQQGMTLSGNPWGAPLFGATFYTLTGFHGLHVFVGVVYLLAILLGGIRSASLPAYHDRIEMAGLYWHFVDIVWLFVFTCVYLL